MTPEEYKKLPKTPESEHRVLNAVLDRISKAMGPEFTQCEALVGHQLREAAKYQSDLTWERLRNLGLFWALLDFGPFRRQLDAALRETQSTPEDMRRDLYRLALQSCARALAEVETLREEIAELRADKEPAPTDPIDEAGDLDDLLKPSDIEGYNDASGDPNA